MSAFAGNLDWPLVSSDRHSAVIDCRNYQLSGYSWNYTTCRLLMAILIHKRHVKITASSYRQDVTLMLNGIKTRRQPGGKFVSDINIAHG